MHRWKLLGIFAVLAIGTISAAAYWSYTAPGPAASGAQHIAEAAADAADTAADDSNSATAARPPPGLVEPADAENGQLSAAANAIAASEPSTPSPEAKSDNGASASESEKHLTWYIGLPKSDSCIKMELVTGVTTPDEERKKLEAEDMPQSEIASPGVVWLQPRNHPQSAGMMFLQGKTECEGYLTYMAWSPGLKISGE